MVDATPKFTLSSDGTSIAYWARPARNGSKETVVFVNGYATSTFYWDAYLPKISARAITWDLRGHGRSGPSKDLDRTTIEACVEDLVAVLNACEIETATLVAFSLGCQIILEAWGHIPERIAGLIPILGTYKRPFDTVVHPLLGNAIYSALKLGGNGAGKYWMGAAHLATRSPISHKVNQLFGMVSKDVSNASLQPMYDHFSDIDGATWVAMGLAAQEHSAKHLLAGIDVPTLIIGGGKDLLTPKLLSYEMRDAIPGAKLVMIESATHAGLLEHPEVIGKHIVEFIDG